MVTLACGVLNSDIGIHILSALLCTSCIGLGWIALVGAIKKGLRARLSSCLLLFGRVPIKCEAESFWALEKLHVSIKLGLDECKRAGMNSAQT